MSVLRLSIVFAVFTCTCAQKPFYASSNNQYPSVLPQNLPPSNSDVGNRIGENSTPDPFLGSEKQPIYNVEKELVDRISSQYPRDKQPFWYVNAAQLDSIRYQQQPVVQSAVQPVVQPAVQPAVQPTRRQQVNVQRQQRN